jgi:hypothetical protein
MTIFGKTARYEDVTNGLPRAPDRLSDPLPASRIRARVSPAAAARFVPDSPLEEEGFELLVPPSNRTAVRRARPSFFGTRLHRLRSF